MEGLDLSSSWLWFTEQYIDLLEKFIPESKPRQKREKAGPVVTQSCLDAIKKWLKYMYKYCKSPVNFNQYKIARNAVTLELRSAKYAYEKDLAARIKTDNKLFWNYVSKNSKTKKSVSQLLSSDGTLTSSDQETANTLNEYFSSVFSNENTNTIPDFNDRNFNHELDQIVITEKKVEEIISNLKPSKSQGPDKIHPHFLKLLKTNKRSVEKAAMYFIQQILSRIQITRLLEKSKRNSYFQERRQKTSRKLSTHQSYLRSRQDYGTHNKG